MRACQDLNPDLSDSESRTLIMHYNYSIALENERQNRKSESAKIPQGHAKLSVPFSLHILFYIIFGNFILTFLFLFSSYYIIFFIFYFIFFHLFLHIFAILFQLFNLVFYSSSLLIISFTLFFILLYFFLIYYFLSFYFKLSILVTKKILFFLDKNNNLKKKLQEIYIETGLMGVFW